MAEVEHYQRCLFCHWDSRFDKELPSSHDPKCLGTVVDELTDPRPDEPHIWADPNIHPQFPPYFDETEVRSKSSTGGEKGVKIQRFDLIPIGPLTELAEHYGYGAKKYADHNWRAGYEWGKSYSAMMRHFTAFWAGEDYDVCPPDNPPEGGNGCITLNEDGEVLQQVGWRNGGRTCLNHTGSHHLVCGVWHGFTLLEYKDVHPDFDDRYTTQIRRLTEQASTKMD